MGDAGGREEHNIPLLELQYNLELMKDKVAGSQVAKITKDENSAETSN